MLQSMLRGASQLCVQATSQVVLELRNEQKRIEMNRNEWKRIENEQTCIVNVLY